MNPSHPVHVLFLCNSNAARSLIAQALLNHLGKGRFVAYSAGHAPTPDGKPDPRTIEALKGAGLPTDGLRSKSWDEYGLASAPHMDLVVTLCDQAAGETCPVWPGHQPAAAHWSHPDPRGESAGDEVDAFVKTMHAIRRHVELLVNLPDERIERLVIQSEARRIGMSAGEHASPTP
ncbi:arsenate reductase ArsC [Variovorax sp. AFSI2.2]|uniref:arsenate reductase ArsC n=1 Tax=Variovorax sp. AFSI2.2 TaxID=3384160 RepID=UPI003EBD09D7